MFRALIITFLILMATGARANDLEDADKAWSVGKPWPSHWGLVQYPYKEGWNVVLLGYVNKVYSKEEAADTWLKNITYAKQDGASVEVCMMKRGLLQLAGWCKPAVVDPEIKGTLHEGDVIAYFYPNHGTKRFSDGPGTDARTTLRVFQKISDASDDSCWVREAMVFRRPLADACFKKIDVSLTEKLLTRDFGPRAGSQTVVLSEAYVVGKKVEASEIIPVSIATTPGNKGEDVEHLNKAEESNDRVFGTKPY